MWRPVEDALVITTSGAHINAFGHVIGRGHVNTFTLAARIAVCWTPGHNPAAPPWPDIGLGQSERLIKSAGQLAVVSGRRRGGRA